ncbi:MAG TPA: glycosyltransferase family 87 protein [Gemmataceae bacterium]|nr:glycosyltransferase family 87 protein [Gemmataceae bacterium]
MPQPGITGKGCPFIPSQQFNQGQLNAFLLLLLTAAWAADRSGKPWLSGALLGTATAIKLFPGFLFLYPVCRGQWRPVVSGTLAFVAVNGRALALLGPSTFTDYYHHVLPHLGIYRDVWLNSSLSGYWHKLFDSRSGHTIPLWHAPLIAQFGTVACCTVVVILVALLTASAQTRRQKDLAFGLTLNGMLLVSPITWDHYFLLAALPLFMLWLWVPRQGPLRLAVQILLVVLSLGPKFYWNLVMPGVGEREGQIASAWQTVAFVSYLFYGSLALFALGVIMIGRSARPIARKGSAWLPRYRSQRRFVRSSSMPSAH